MGRYGLLILLVLTIRATVVGQVVPASQLQQRINKARRTSAATTFPLFKLADSPAYQGTAFLPSETPTSLLLDAGQLSRILDERPDLLAFSIPTESGSIDLDLVAVELFSPDSKLLLGSAAGTVTAPLSKGVFYQGFIKGDDQSLVAISITNGELSGIVSDKTGNRALSHLRNTQNSYLFYSDNTVLTPRKAFTCEAIPVNTGGRKTAMAPQSIDCKVVGIYLEVDFDLYTQNKSDVAQTTSYVANLFNQVALIYNRENIAIRIAGIKLWTEADPYVSLTSTGDILSAFRANQNANPPPGVNSQLSHFLSGRSLGGGVAYLDVLCASTYKYGVSGSLSATYPEFPTYSWEVTVVTHELGHNFGSPHTQSCSWPGGALDNCYTTEGGCAPGPAPVNGGTIMSYCHLTTTGINLSNGFGTLPGNLIRSRVTTSSCLPTATDVPTSLATRRVQATTATTYWLSNSGSTQFTIQYRPVGDASWRTVGPFTGSRYTLTGLQPNTTYNWRVTGECSSSYSTESTFTTGDPVYCTPLYSNNGCEYGIGLKRIVFNGTVLTTSSGCAASHYTYYPTPVATLSKIVANPFSIEFLGYYNAQQVAVWIDFDQNYEFDTSERVFGTTAGVKAPVSGSLTIPATVQAGVTYRMRIRNQFSSSVTDACNELSYGEAEDYLVFIDSGCPPTPAITLSASAITCQQSATLTVTNCSGTVSWLPGNGSGASIMVNPTQTTSYTATCNLPGCSVSQQATVTVAPDMVSLHSGNWDDPGVWSCQRVPTAVTPLLISAGHTVIMPANYTGNAGSLILTGRLNYQINSRLKLGTPIANVVLVK
ncbi:M12 family metallo-peptidase [Fibrella arboris]|uniref:M12 family metallo-peptidase n=1 Tax=Fibrella arboris TaxID=3242486 RepID=UPI00352260E6